MNPKCVQAINTAAGRTLSEAEIRNIEDRVRIARVELARTKPAEYRAMSPQEQMNAAAALAKDRWMKDAAKAVDSSVREADRAAQRTAELARIKPGPNGQTQYVRDLVSSIERRTEAIATEVLRSIKVADLGKWLGILRDERLTEDFVANYRGEKTDPQFTEAVQATKAAMRAIEDFYEASGLPLHRAEDYLPQKQNPNRVTSREEWLADMASAIGTDDMLNPDGSYRSPAQVRAFLEAGYETIVTNGASKTADGRPSTGVGAGGGMVGAATNMPRQFHYKDAASYLRIMEKYGESSNPYEQLVSHIRRMALDIATVEKFGRTADAEVGRLLKLAESADRQATKSERQAQGIEKLQSKVMDLYRGIRHPERPLSARGAHISSQIRGFERAVYLGMHPLMSAIDMGLMHMATRLQGLPTVKAYRYALEGLGSTKDAKRAGLILDGIQHAVSQHTASNFLGNIGTWMSDRTHTLSVMRRLDNGSRTGAGRVVMDALAEGIQKHATLESLEQGSRFIRNLGVTEDHYAIWKAAKLDDHDWGGQLLTPDAVHNVPDEVIRPIAERAVASRSEALAAEITKRGERSVQETQWLQDRVDKFKAKKAEVYAKLEELKEARQGKAEAKMEGAESRGEALKATTALVEVEHDIAVALKTEMTESQVLSFLEAVEEGASVERTSVKASSTVRRLASDTDRLGYNLGRRRAAAEARAKDAVRRADEYQSKIDKQGDRAEKAAAKRFADWQQDLMDQAQELRERVARRQDYAAAFQARIGEVLDAEVGRLRMDATVKLHEVIQDNTRFLVRGSLAMNAEERQLFYGRTRTGTWSGEALRFLAMFKTTTMGVVREHLIRSAELGTWDKAGYRAGALATSMLTASLVLETKALLNGQDPRSIDPSTEEGRRFWLDSLMASGSFGMAGDLLFNGNTAQGSGYEILLGPAATTTVDVGRELGAAINNSIQEEPSDRPYALAATRWARKNLVPFMNIWYAKAAFNRLVYDKLQDSLDPGHSAAQRRRMEARGASYWWGPGETEPERAPDLDKLVEE